MTNGFMNGNRGAGRSSDMGENNFEDTRSSPSFQTPPQQTFDSPEMEGSMQRILATNVGEFVVIEFLIGTELIMRKQGILYSVGTSYVTLYDDMQNNFIVCDIFSIKFVYFYYPGDRPRGNVNLLPGSDNGNGRMQQNRR